MTPEEQNNQYRFSGYQLPLIQLDETGPAYVVLPPHPYYRHQPLYWQKAAFGGNSYPYKQYGGDFPLSSSGNIYPNAKSAPIDLLQFY